MHSERCRFGTFHEAVIHHREIHQRRGRTGRKGDCGWNGRVIRAIGGRAAHGDVDREGTGGGSGAGEGELAVVGWLAGNGIGCHDRHRWKIVIGNGDRCSWSTGCISGSSLHSERCRFGAFYEGVLNHREIHQRRGRTGRKGDSGWNGRVIRAIGGRAAHGDVDREGTGGGSGAGEGELAVVGGLAGKGIGRHYCDGGEQAVYQLLVGKDHPKKGEILHPIPNLVDVCAAG